MFNQTEWKQTQRTINGSRVYENKQTGLPKLRNSFTREQQHQLDEHFDVKIWQATEYRKEDAP
jgi:hypothetical protein